MTNFRLAVKAFIVQDNKLLLLKRRSNDVHHFTRDDGQVITMLIFLCEPLSQAIKLSEEHTEYQWESLDSSNIPSWLEPVISNYRHIN